MGRTAVVGAGISGLGAARFLAGDGEVVVYEAEPRLGGHARTLTVPRQSGGVPVDTGFIVYNEVNYPLLTALFAELGVPTIPSDMSFGVKIDGFEMCASSLPGLFAQKRNLVAPGHWRMLKDIAAFFKEAPAVLDAADEPSLGDLVARLRLGTLMRDRFLVPMGAAIWSTPPGQILDMPAKTFVRFFRNHNLLTASGHHTWRTVEGGSRVYVEALRKLLADGFSVSFRTGAAVTRIEPRSGGGHEVITADGQRDVFDEVVLACHADASLNLIAAPSEAERSVLGAFEFRDNLAILHRDASHMPRARGAWASWVYSSTSAEAGRSVSVTYWMNRLQSLPGEPLLITLNPSQPIAESTVLDRHTFRHPVLSREAVSAQARLPQIQGKRGLWFCGAWTRYGFHEDGILSAANVAKAKGLKLPWRVAA